MQSSISSKRYEVGNRYSQTESSQRPGTANPRKSAFLERPTTPRAERRDKEDEVQVHLNSFLGRVLKEGSGAFLRRDYQLLIREFNEVADYTNNRLEYLFIKILSRSKLDKSRRTELSEKIGSGEVKVNHRRMTEEEIKDLETCSEVLKHFLGEDPEDVKGVSKLNRVHEFIEIFCNSNKGVMLDTTRGEMAMFRNLMAREQAFLLRGEPSSSKAISREKWAMFSEIAMQIEGREALYRHLFQESEIKYGRESGLCKVYKSLLRGETLKRFVERQKEVSGKKQKKEAQRLTPRSNKKIVRSRQQVSTAVPAAQFHLDIHMVRKIAAILCVVFACIAVAIMAFLLIVDYLSNPSGCRRVP